MGALAHVGGVARVATPPARVEIEDGLAVISVGGRIALVDCLNFQPDGKEMVVIRHDGRVALERVQARINLGSSPRAYYSAEVVREGPASSYYGVTVLGRVVRYLN